MIRHDISKEDRERLEANFTFHQPKGNQQGRYAEIRYTAKTMTEKLMSSCPKSRELSLALTKIEEAVFWANAAIARNE